MGSDDVPARERQLQEQVKRWQAQTQALQQEDVHLKTELAAACLAVRKNIIWGVPIVPLGALLLLMTPYYIAYKPAVYVLDAVMATVALVTLVMVILDSVSRWFCAGSKVRTAGVAAGGNAAADPLVCGTPVRTNPDTWPWVNAQHNRILRSQALVASGAQLVDDLLQVGIQDSNKDSSMNSKLALLQERAKAWRIQQQALSEEEENAHLKSELADALARSTGFATWKFAWLIGSVIVLLVLQFMMFVPWTDGTKETEWSDFFLKTELQLTCAVTVLFYVPLVGPNNPQCKELSEKSKKLLEEVAKRFAAAEAKRTGEAQVIVICHSTEMHTTLHNVV